MKAGQLFDWMYCASSGGGIDSTKNCLQHKCWRKTCLLFINYLLILLYASIINIWFYSRSIYKWLTSRYVPSCLCYSTHYDIDICSCQMRSLVTCFCYQSWFWVRDAIESIIYHSQQRNAIPRNGSQLSHIASLHFNKFNFHNWYRLRMKWSVFLTWLKIHLNVFWALW